MTSTCCYKYSYLHHDAMKPPQSTIYSCTLAVSLKSGYNPCTREYKPCTRGYSENPCTIGYNPCSRGYSNNPCTRMYNPCTRRYNPCTIWGAIHVPEGTIHVPEGTIHVSGIARSQTMPRHCTRLFFAFFSFGRGRGGRAGGMHP